jgi:hypothetical protein
VKGKKNLLPLSIIMQNNVALSAVKGKHFSLLPVMSVLVVQVLRVGCATDFQVL